MKLVVLVLRGCPLGWLGAYGNEWVATPNLDRFAAEGIVFDRHISDCPEANAARTAWRTGRDAFRNFNTPAADLLQIFRDAGILTAIVRANRESNDAHPDYYAAWGKVFDARPVPGEQIGLLRERPKILEELKGRTDWLLQVELDTLLPPWTVPQPLFEAYLEDLTGEEADPGEEAVSPWANPEVGWFDTDDLDSWELLHRTFAAVITDLDHDLGEVFDLIAAENAAGLVTSDFGYPLGEHGLLGPHRPWLHEEFVHLPLLLRLPDRANAGYRVAGYTQPADLMPTVLKLFALPIPSDLHGRELTNLKPTREKAISALTHDGASEIAVRTEDWACLLPTAQHPDDADEPRTAKLYVKPDDRCEVNDLASSKPDVVESLTTALNNPDGFDSTWQFHFNN